MILAFNKPLPLNSLSGLVFVSDTYESVFQFQKLYLYFLLFSHRASCLLKKSIISRRCMFCGMQPRRKRERFICECSAANRSVQIGFVARRVTDALGPVS